MSTPAERAKLQGIVLTILVGTLGFPLLAHVIARILA